MIVGRLYNLEAIIDLDVSASGNSPHRVEVILDTGFNGYLTLTGRLVAALKLPFVGHRRGTLANGTITRLDVYQAIVEWHGQPKEVLIVQAEGKPLIGMSLLEGSRLIIDVVDGGDVIIAELSSTL